MISIVALLTVKDADAFERFESQAVAIMAAYGGRLETAFRPRASEQTPRVDEIHVIKFPDLEAFESYRDDARIKSLATLREQAISQTTVYVSSEHTD